MRGGAPGFFQAAKEGCEMGSEAASCATTLRLAAGSGAPKSEPKAIVARAAAAAPESIGGGGGRCSIWIPTDARQKSPCVPPPAAPAAPADAPQTSVGGTP